MRRLKIRVNRNLLYSAVLLVASIVLLLFLVSTSSRLREENLVHPPLVDGVFDMRDVDFARKQAHALYMTYQFYPGEYENPDELAGVAPVDYNNENLNGASAAVFRFNILLPDDSPVYTEFALPGCYGRLFVNGKLVDGNLPYGRDSEGVGYTYQYKSVMTPINGRLDIVMTVRAYDDGTYNWSYLKISNPGLQTQFENRLVMLDALYIGGLALSFGLFLVLFFLMGRMSENLYFAVICMLMALRRSVVSAQIIFLALPGFHYSIKVEHITLSLVMPFLVLYLNRVFPKLFHKSVLAGIAGSYFLYALLIAFTPYSFYRSFLLFGYAITAVAMVYFFVRFIITQKRMNLEQAIALTGLLTLCMAMVNDVLYYSGIKFANGIGFFELMEQATLIFALLQMVSLFLSNARQTAEARQAEHQLSEQNAALDRLNRLKTEFLSNVSHELKTPLAVMMSIAQNAQQTLESRDSGDGLISDMKLLSSENRRLSLMVTQVLDATRIEENSMIWNLVPCDINEIIQTTKAAYYPLLKKNGNRLMTAPCRDLPLIYADPDRISQVLVNTLQNAIRHTQNGEIAISAQDIGGFVEVSVSDTGEGIELNQLPHIFERFKSHDSSVEARRGSDTGTGLGLYICRHIIENHGGIITVESRPGKGTTVRFTIPVHQSAG